MQEPAFRDVGRLLGRGGPFQGGVAVREAAKGRDDAAVKDLLLDREGIDRPEVLGRRVEDLLRKRVGAVELREVVGSLAVGQRKLVG
jgi:hypothetical protein